MIHIAFTIHNGGALTIIKDADHQVIRRETHALHHVSGPLADWLACKAALRLGGSLTRGDVALYSDLPVIEQLCALQPPAAAPGRVDKNGLTTEQRAAGREMAQYFEVLAMLWTLFRGRWTACRVGQERIVAAMELTP